MSSVPRGGGCGCFPGHLTSLSSGQEASCLSALCPPGMRFESRLMCILIISQETAMGAGSGSVPQMGLTVPLLSPLGSVAGLSAGGPSAGWGGTYPEGPVQASPLLSGALLYLKLSPHCSQPHAHGKTGHRSEMTAWTAGGHGDSSGHQDRSEGWPPAQATRGLGYVGQAGPTAPEHSLTDFGLRS